jgi:cyclopropane fatty-acyl-phospholipid synthase-like methyltransferase
MSATLEIVEHNKDLMARLTGMFEAVLGSGGHLHWGYFDNKRRTLREAQDALIDQIARVARIDRDARVLDVGCGIGGTPLYLQRSHGCRTVGLTNSPVGCDRSRALALEAGVADSVGFVLADALDNGLPDDSFDAVIMVEAAYMIPDKERLFTENLRVLKPGGRFIICDNMTGRPMNFGEMLKFHRGNLALKNTFGEGSYESLGNHARLAARVGFESATTHDIGLHVLPTIDRLVDSIEHRRASLERDFGADCIADVIMSFQHTRRLCDLGISTYGMLVAVK